MINRLVKGTPATKLQKWGICLALLGITIVFGNQLLIKVDVIEIVAMIVILCAMFGSAFIQIKVQQRIRSLPILSFNSLSMLSGGAVLLMRIKTHTGKRSCPAFKDEAADEQYRSAAQH